MAKRKLKPRREPELVKPEADPGEDFSPRGRPAKPKGTEASGPTVINMEELHGKKRKLTKKAVQSLEVWKGKDRHRARDGMFAEMARRNREKFGHAGVFAGNESSQLIVGIPLPALCLEYLFQQDVLPLGLVYLICGKWGSCKSAWLYEIFRWFDQCNGGGILEEAELKFSPDLAASIMGYLGTDFMPLIIKRCTSLEDWQKKLTFDLDNQKQLMVGTAEAPGPGRTVPVAFGVDSLMARGSEEVTEDIQKAGFAGRGFPVETLSITRYMRSMCGEFENWPFALFLVNHLKDNINQETGELSYRQPGGDFAQFQESFQFQLAPWARKIDTSEFEGIGIRIKCSKNSLGPTGKEIRTRMLWWEENVGTPGKPIYIQRTIWDWNWATVTMLNELTGRDSARVKEAGFRLEVKSPKGHLDCLAQCPNVGMGKNEWARFSEVGARIQANAEVMELLRTALGIKRRNLLHGDYLEQLNQLAKGLE